MTDEQIIEHIADGTPADDVASAIVDRAVADGDTDDVEIIWLDARARIDSVIAAAGGL